MDIFGFNVPIDSPAVAQSGDIGTVITLILAFIMFAVTGIIIIYVVYQSKLFSKTINVFENIAGQGYQLTGKDKARLIKVGDGGEEILFLKKRKAYRTAYGRKMGKNTYWFAIGQDGYWYNVLLGDLDTKMGMLDIEPIDRDMRYMHVAIRKNIQDRYQKKKMEKIIAWTITGVAATSLIMMIGGWFIVKEMSEAAKLTSQNINAVSPIAEALEKAVSHLDTICGGSGIHPAG